MNSLYEDHADKVKKVDETLEYHDLCIDFNTGLNKVKPMVEKSNYLIDIGRHSEAVIMSKDILDVISSEAVDIQALKAEAEPLVDEIFDDLEDSTKKFIKVKLYDGARYLQISMRILTNTFASEETKEDKLRRLDSMPQVIPYTKEELCLRKKLMLKDLKRIQSKIDKKKGFKKFKPMLEKANYLLDTGEYDRAIFASYDIEREVASKTVLINSIQSSVIDQIFYYLESLAKNFIEVKLFNGAIYLLPAIDRLIRTYTSGKSKKDKLKRIKDLTKTLPDHLIQHDFGD